MGYSGDSCRYGGGRKEREGGEGGRSIYAKQPVSRIICMHWPRMWVRESRNVVCVQQNASEKSSIFFEK